MANTFASLYVHVVFSTKNRAPHIAAEIEDDVWRYLGGICRTHGVKALQIGGVDDHVHLLLSYGPTLALSDFMKRLKGESSKWIFGRWPALGAFSWQDGYGAFSIGKSQVAAMLSYIQGQRAHHAKVPFEAEYRRFLHVHDIEAEERFIFG